MKTALPKQHRKTNRGNIVNMYEVLQELTKAWETRKTIRKHIKIEKAIEIAQKHGKALIIQMQYNSHRGAKRKQ